MPRTAALDRPSVKKILGIGFLAMLLFFVWLTFAFFNKTFVSTDDVTLKTSKTGSQLPQAADVKLRGMIVGEVTDQKVTDDGVELTLGLDPDLIGDIPAGVTAQILPKTLFGEKFVALIPPAITSTDSLEAGDVITKAEVPIELEEVLNNLYGLLEAVEPADLSNTLTAVSSALEGRGEQLGDTLVQLNAYLTEINPDIPLAVDDLIALGEVSDVYAAALPDLARVLENSVVTGNTIVEKDAQLTSFLASTTTLANTLTTFFATSGQDLIDLNANSRRGLYQAGRYSVTFPCFLAALDTVVPRLDSLFRGGALHINLEIITPGIPETTRGGMPTPYTLDEKPVISYEEANSAENASLVEPTCLQLDQLAEGVNLFPQETPYPGPPRAAELYQLVGVKSPHGKFFSADGTPAGSADRTGVANEWTMLDTLVTSSVGLDPSTSSDLAPLLLGTMYEGAEVAVR
ncbi:MAG: MCE family protein [Aeromicrobium sp.]|uniref:MCE family protein n=1 Tax=Aeromicrobium sp. TaxID=1871063 RepID=UPI0025C59B29|nr:MCE family protein [Aeromicrobium sp.]MCK5891367.1 MCE family protein [Aeromicrobium sp.]MDF1704487.1 MCE family protein [Aeromicrobium sp.]